ncbi:MAG: hypothetical protein IT454_13795 [Planctomycetes bacterium]|nr:hypothetical protein [Planctomycetota bacterium]
MKHLATLFVALASLASCRTSEEERIEEQTLAWHREFALRLLDDGQLANALNQVNLGLEIDSDDERLLLIKSRIHLQRGSAADVNAAEELLREFAGDDNFIACVGLGEALERQGVLRWESAREIESGKRATTAADPARRALDLRDEAQARWSESTQWYESALKIKPDYIQAINGLQRVWALRGDLARSLAASERLLALADKEVEFWRAELARPEIKAEYEAELRRRIQASAKLLTETHMSASTALVALGRSADAMAHLDASVQLEPSRAEIYSRRAQLHLAAGRAREASEDLRQFLKLSTLPIEAPDMVRAFDLLAQCEVALEAASSTNSPATR